MIRATAQIASEGGWLGEGTEVHFTRPYLSNRALFVLLILVGMYFPTGILWLPDSVVSRADFALCGLLLVILAWRVRVDESTFLRFSGPIVIWLGLCTIPALFHLTQVTLTPLLFYGFLAFLLCIRVGELRCSNLTNCLAIISAANLVLGVTMVTVPAVSTFMVSHYNDFAEDMVLGMIAANKPVLTFATHSLAGLFIYIFFWLNFRTYQLTGRKSHLVLAVLHVALCVSLMSVTALGLATAAVAELFWTFRKTAIVTVLAIFLLVPLDLKSTVADAVIAATWLREGGGFLARYTTYGVLADSFAYIRNHPFRPIGLMYSSRILSTGAGTDSSLVYYLRGSFVLVVLIYGGFFLFLRRNLRDKWVCYRLFFLVPVAELGAVVLVYPRSFLLIPAFVIYLNSLPAASSSRAVHLEAFLNRGRMVVPGTASEAATHA